MALAAAAPCRNHPDREAIGICVRCRTRVCSECSTKIDGINYCVTCLTAAAGAAAGDRRRTTRVGPRASSRLGGIVASVALLLVGTLLVWGMLEALLPRAG